MKSNEHKITDRFSYTEEVDNNGMKFYELWDYSKMHGQGSLKSPTSVRTSYNLFVIRSTALLRSSKEEREKYYKELEQKFDEVGRKRKNVTRIRITGIFTNWQGKMRERYLDETLLLRTARQVGDEENVNNNVLGRLRRAQESGQITFEKVSQ